MVENIVLEVYPYLEAGLCGGGGAPPWELVTKNKVSIMTPSSVITLNRLIL